MIYPSAKFKVPLTIALDPQPRFTLEEDSPNFLTWTSAYDSNNRVRLMIPVEYYPAGVGPAKPAPRDYVTYLKTLKMMTYTHVGTVTVDGETGPIMTANVMEGGLDGSIGCAIAGADQADGCFGFQPDFSIRIAVLKHRNLTILVWARTNANLPDKTFLGQFETMLRSIKWR